MITVIIPCYNYARFLAEAVDSALEQCGPDLAVEVVVIDDGSTDDSPEVAAGYGDRIRYHRKDNAGLSAARNTGMELASHDLVLFLDADDILLPGALAALLEARRRLDPPPAVLASKHLPVDVDGCPFSAEHPATGGNVNHVSVRDLVLRNRFAPAVLADRRLLLSLGGFDPELWASEDRDLWIRVAAHHPVTLLDHYTLLKRDHGECMSRAAAKQTAAIERVLKKAFSNPDMDISAIDRRRARAVCHYQSALMFADAGARLSAIARMTQSLITFPIGHVDCTIPRLSRLRGLVSLLFRK